MGQPNDTRSKIWLLPKANKVIRHCKTKEKSGNIKILKEGARHLGTVFGDISFKEDYLRNVIHSW